MTTADRCSCGWVWFPVQTFDLSPAPCGSYAAAGGDGDLDGVAARLTHVFQVEGLVGRLVVSSFDGERRGVDADLWRTRRRPGLTFDLRAM